MTTIITERSTSFVETYPQYRFVIAGLILAANFTIGLLWSAIAPLLPLVIEGFKISSATASLLVALPVLIKAAIGLPGSLIIARFGLRRIFTISWYLMGALALSSMAPNYLSLLLLRLSYGVGAGLMMPALGTLVMQWFPSKERTVLNSMNLIVFSLGISISYALAAPLVKIMPWQNVLGLFGTVGLLGAVAWNLLGRTQSETANVKFDFNLKEVWAVLSNKTIFLIYFGDALVFTCYAALSNWLPTYFYKVRGMSLSQAGNITGLLPFVGIFAVVAGGFLALKVKEKRWFFIIPGILVVVGSFGSFLSTTTTGITVFVMLLGIGAWVYQPILLSLPMELTWMTPNKIAIVWGASMTVAGFGMFLSPIIVGASQDIFGTFVPGFIICALPALVLILSGILLPKNDADNLV
ncbi:MAG: MFS transporter [Chloroflexi bacterium]|nr:MFS transporter [Chloroflexota bacterium]